MSKVYRCQSYNSSDRLEMGKGSSPCIVVEVYEAPKGMCKVVLSTADARRLAQDLIQEADEVDGVSIQNNPYLPPNFRLPDRRFRKCYKCPFKESADSPDRLILGLCPRCREEDQKR